MTAGCDDLKIGFKAQALADARPEIAEPADDYDAQVSPRQITRVATSKPAITIAGQQPI
jgi:hypothetical protein